MLFMNKAKSFYLAVIPLLSMGALSSCNQTPVEKPIKEYEIGETVKEWKSVKNYNALPVEPMAKNSVGEIVKDFGNEDKSSLKFTVKSGSSSQNYVGSDVLKKPYFLEGDAKNGDIISLYFYVPKNSNVSSLQLQVYPISMNSPIKGTAVTISADNEEQWIRTTASFDTLETLGAIRLVYTLKDTSNTGTFFIDNINITYGTETVKTKYESKGESLYKTYANYFKVGSCMSANMLNNTTLRRIARDNFNSLTAENEAKPEQILNKTACQNLAKEGKESEVSVTLKPMERLYDFCEAYHIGVRHHTFVWYSQVPAWFFNVGYEDNGSQVSKDVMLKRMENFIKTTLQRVNKRWPGLVYAIDVANEAVDNHTIRSNNNNWYTVVGKDFVYYAFKYARQYAEKDQKLYYNDYSYDYDTENCKYALNTLLKKAISEKLIDGVGIQGHIKDDQTPVNVMNDAKMIFNKGLECQITELDITTPGNAASNFKKKSKLYHDLIVETLKNNRDGKTNITAIVLWGITDNLSWRARDQEKWPLLFNEDYSKKPAYYGFLDAIKDVYPETDSSSESK